MALRLDSRQARQRSRLDQLSTTTDIRLDAILNLINDELTPPLRLRSNERYSGNSDVNDQRLWIDGIEVLTNDAVPSDTGTDRSRTIPPINNLMPSYAGGGSITFNASTGVATGTGLTLATSYTLPSMTNGQWVWVMVMINGLGNFLLSFGTPGASKAAATKPVAFSNTFAIGLVAIQRGSSTYGTVNNENIVQFVGGGGGGGSGTGNPILETVKNTLLDSTYELVTPNIFKVNENALVDGASTGAYSLITNAFEFASTGQTYVSRQMLDSSEFLGQSKDVNKVMLQALWTPGSVDTAATYQVSRDGGTNWKNVTMSRVGVATETYVGEYTWTSEDTAVSVGTAGGTGATTALNLTTNARIAGPAQLTSTTLFAAATQVRFTLARTGSPTGNLYASLVKLSGGLVSTNPADVIASSGPLDMSTLTGSATVYTFSMGPGILAPGTSYAVVLRADYISFSAGVNEVVVTRASSGTTGQLYNATTGVWSSGTISVPEITILGRSLDLRVRIASSAGSRALDGVAIYYDPTYMSPATGVKRLDTKRFMSTDNLSSFTINFLPDPDLLTVYYVEGGQAFRFGAFSLDGYTVRFPTNSFNNGGVASTVTLVFEQTSGGSFDNSDLNRSLMSSNYLGSMDGSNDLSSPARGIKLRNGAGTLVELAIDSSNNIIISTLP